MKRQHSRSHSRERAQNVHSHPPQHRSPSWKGASSQSSSHVHPQERHMAVPRKRRISDVHHPPPDHGSPKHPRGGRPQLVNTPRQWGGRPFGSRPFGGRPLSLRDKSYMLKSRQMRAESLMRLRLPPPPVKARGSISAVLALRKKRFQSNAEPLRKLEPREVKLRLSPTKAEVNASRSSKDSDSGNEQVESQRSVNTHRYGIFLLALFAGA